MRMANAATATQGRWHGILPTLGVPANALRNKHGQCPLGCGGKRSFRFDDKGGRGTWICSHCGSGDGFDLIAGMQHVSVKEAMAMAVEAATGVKQRAPQPKMTDEEARRRGRIMWRKSEAIQRDDPAGRYLFRRLGFFPRDTGLRIAETEYFSGTGSMLYPTMLAPVISPSGAIVGLHRTYLTSTGHKAEVESPKKLLRWDDTAGAAIRLSAAAATIGLAEGIETALAAGHRFMLPTWAAISAVGMMKFIPPAAVRHVDIFADHDLNGAGQLAAFTLMNRLILKDHLSALVHISPTPGNDWADEE